MSAIPYPGSVYSGNVPVANPNQYLRKWTLALGKSGNPLPGAAAGQNNIRVITTETPDHDFRMTFKIRSADIETPGTAEIRVYNLADSTAMDAVKEFDQVTLEAGYQEGNYGVLFSGTIKQFKKGRENATDSYLDIFAADGDAIWNFKFINTVVPPGSTAETRQKAIVDRATEAGAGNVQKGEMAPLGGTVPLVRSRTMFGALTDEAREHGRSSETTWSIQKGVIHNIASTAYKRGDIIDINSQTGMITAPELTQDGIFITCLLNPKLYIKGRVRVNNTDLNRYQLPGGGQIQGGPESIYPQYAGGTRYFASTAQDGVYCILVLDHDGDTRGLPWYTRMVCLNVSPEQPFNTAVSAGDWSPS